VGSGPEPVAAGVQVDVAPVVVMMLRRSPEEGREAGGGVQVGDALLLGAALDLPMWTERPFCLAGTVRRNLLVMGDAGQQ